MRTAKISRDTKETKIALELNLDGSGEGVISTGIGFFDHMLELLKKHALIDLTVKADGDLKVDYHHTVEDVGLVLGKALDQALGDRKGIVRYGFASIPMDEALCETSLDLGGRPFLVMQCAMKHMFVKDFEVKLVEEFFRAVSVESRSNIHLRQIYGDEAHHVCEGLFKSFARALRQAKAVDPNERGVPSSKGAIDLKDGKCVRLRQGRADDVTVYGDDPAAQAKDWREQGGEELHVVDLDGAFAGTPKHAETIARIIEAFGGPVEVGGGLRDPESLRAVLEAGAARAIIGSAALEDPAFLSEALELYGDKIAVGIDARDGFVQTKGWVETTKVKATELAAAVAKAGVKTIIYTDTATDGMLGGPNLTQMAAICDAAPTCQITASGGVSSPFDIENLKALERPNLRAAIVGKALYDGRTTLKEIKRAAL